MGRQEEQLRATVCHVLNAVPVWGMVSSALIWFTARDRSKYLLAQSRQAMMFHGILLGVLVAWMAIEVFTRMLGALLPPLGIFLHGLNLLIIVICLLVYVAICIWGGVQSWAGEPFDYPFVGDASQ